MLQRYQVLLSDWLTEHIKKIAERYDLSFSETIRAALCIFYGEVIAKDCPQCKVKIKPIKKEVTLKEGHYDKKAREKFHRGLSDTYFEARKAIECFWNEEKKRKNKA